MREQHTTTLYRKVTSSKQRHFNIYNTQGNTCMSALKKIKITIIKNMPLATIALHSQTVEISKLAHTTQHIKLCKIDASIWWALWVVSRHNVVGDYIRITQCNKTAAHLLSSSVVDFFDVCIWKVAQLQVIQWQEYTHTKTTAEA